MFWSLAAKSLMGTKLVSLFVVFDIQIADLFIVHLFSVIEAGICFIKLWFMKWISSNFGIIKLRIISVLMFRKEVVSSTEVVCIVVPHPPTRFPYSLTASFYCSSFRYQETWSGDWSDGEGQGADLFPDFGEKEKIFLFGIRFDHAFSGSLFFPLENNPILNGRW